MFTSADTIVKRLLILFAALSLGACNLDVPAPAGANAGPSDPTKETFSDSLKINLSTMIKTAAGSYYKDAKIGTGTELTLANSVIVISYLGFLKNGNLFAAGSSETQSFGNLVGGLRDAMRGMKVGGERIFVIPSELGYGGGGSLGVPPNSTLVYDIILIGIL
jgi:FKBP-type peptidyl-prolyl cis-trans isomerase